MFRVGRASQRMMEESLKWTSFWLTKPFCLEWGSNSKIRPHSHETLLDAPLGQLLQGRMDAASAEMSA